MSLTNILRSFLHLINIEVKKYPSLDLRRRKKLLEEYKISKILDVGANSGQYATEIFDLGFKGKIVSFEPVEETFDLLQKKVKNNEKWSALKYGLGDKDQELRINLSKNTYSSSLLKIMPSHVQSASESVVVDHEMVLLKKLDTVFREITNDDDIILLKMDVQGFEKNVLEGAKKSLNYIKGIQIEMSIEELYKGELLLSDMMHLLNSKGFTLYSLENGFYNDKTGKLLQVDGIFFRD